MTLAPMMLRALALVVTLSILATAPLRASQLLELNSRPLQAEGTPETLEPWETPISGFFIRSHFGPPPGLSTPQFDLETRAALEKWELRITGLVKKPLTISVASLKADRAKFSLKTLHAVLECSGNGRGLQDPPAPGVQWRRAAIGNAEWTGVPLSELLKAAEVKPEGKYLTLKGADRPVLASVPKFIRSIPIEKAIQADTLLAFGMNREPLPINHGGPLRLVLPGWYGENWTKWILEIEVTDREDPGFYMKKGYRIPKDPLTPLAKWDASTGQAIEKLRVQSLITAPRANQSVAPGKLHVKGKAFSGESRIVKVSLSLDQGKTWLPARVEPLRKTGGWQEFEGEVSVEGRNQEWELWSKAEDSDGNEQPLQAEWNPGGYVRNSVDKIKFQTSQAVGNEAAKRMTPAHILFLQKCLFCHSSELVEAQRLTPAQWDGVLKKMESFGVQLETKERATLLDYLLQLEQNKP